MKRKRQKKDRINEKTLDIAALIDEHFTETEPVKLGESIIRTTCFRAITHQLWMQWIDGSRKAGRLYKRYLKFAAAQVPANRGPDIRFGDDLLTVEDVYRKHGRPMP